MACSKKFRKIGSGLFKVQDSCEKDKQGKKRPVVQGKRGGYCSLNGKVSKSVRQSLKSGLEQVGENRTLTGLLADNECNPSSYNENGWLSRK